MRLISMVTSDAAHDPECDYAVIDLTPELARVALRRINAFNVQKTADDDLIEMYFWDYHVEYFSPWIGEKTEQADGLEEALTSFPRAAPDLMIAPVDFSVPESMAVRVECCRMVTREDAVAFMAIPKHTDSYVHTAEIPLHLIETAALA
ncbi:MAG TPA: hypothetical protein VFZ08_04445 [Terriglobia bacterium]|nr:hypothetical protein [Terriglobia bacterium]